MRRPQLPRLLQLLHIFKSCRRRRNQSRNILQLPLETLLLIIDNLALHDRFLLSHTCRAFRHITAQDWRAAVPRLPFQDRINFWAGLAYTLPGFWVCSKCCKLHPIHTSDFPMCLRSSRGQWFPCAVDHSHRYGGDYFQIQHHHIQLALKLSRRGNMHQKYLAELMSTCIYPTHKLKRFKQSYKAEPRIINGQFLLRESNLENSRNLKRLILSARAQVANLTQRELMAIFRGATLVEDEIDLALESPGWWRFNSCMRCHTDFGVMVTPDKRTATIQAWHNFGVEGSPMDANWRAYTHDSYSTAYDSFVRNGNAPLHHRHGSVRELYYESTPKQPSQKIRWMPYM
ncbi:hypothetical protein V8C26DRAFT_436255 [Trichoderma gracile]